MSIELKQAAEQALKELGEARKIVRASSSRQLAKDWDRRATDALANLRTAIQQAEAQQPIKTQQPATAIACGIPGMAKTTCPYCEQGFAFEHEQPAAPEPAAWMHPSGGVLQALLTGLERRTYTIPLYTHPAPSVPDDVVRDAERFRRLNLTEEAIAVVDSMLAAKEGTNGEIN